MRRGPPGLRVSKCAPPGVAGCPGPRDRGAQGCGGGGAGRAGTQGRGCLGLRGAPGMVIRGSSACFEKSTGHFANECMRPRAAGRAFEPAAHAKCLVARPLQSGTFDTMPKAAYTRWRFDQHFFKFTHLRSKRPSPPAARTRLSPSGRWPYSHAPATHARTPRSVPVFLAIARRNRAKGYNLGNLGGNTEAGTASGAVRPASVRRAAARRKRRPHTGRHQGRSGTW